MKQGTVRLSARDFVDHLASRGRYTFTSADARNSLGVSPAAAKLALNRLAHEQIIASPARGFYVVVPPEYRSLGCVPADQFIPALMQRTNTPYYAGLLSAAQYHGAAHHRPQVFQVLLAKSRRPIKCGQVRVEFFVRKHVGQVASQDFNTPRGIVRVSTPEATALDLVGYQHRIGGLDQVATLLSELAERIDANKLVQAARCAPLPWSQRLGFLLEHTGAAEKADALKNRVNGTALQSVPLLPGSPIDSARRDPDWKLFVNADVEAEL